MLELATLRYLKVLKTVKVPGVETGKSPIKDWINGTYALIKAYRSDILPFSTLLFTVSTTVSCTISNGGGNGNTACGVLSFGLLKSNKIL